MAEIIDLKPKTDLMQWVCMCGCSTFEAYEDNSLVCSACGTNILNDGPSGWHLPPKDKVWEGDAPFKDVYGNGSIEFAKRRMQQRVMEEDACLIVVAMGNGATSTWSKVETEEQLNWAQEMLDNAYEMISKFAKERDSKE